MMPLLHCMFRHHIYISYFITCFSSTVVKTQLMSTRLPKSKWVCQYCTNKPESKDEGIFEEHKGAPVPPIWCPGIMHVGVHVTLEIRTIRA